MSLALPTLPITPIHDFRLPGIDDLSTHLYIKRDDLLPIALGGNKVRIALEYLADMDAREHDALVMYGDLQSNLCRVLAGLCHEHRIPSVMVASSHEEGCPRSFNERIVRSLGVDVIQCEGISIAEGVDEAMDRLRKLGYNPYYIYGNRFGTGNEGVGARAYEQTYHEICNQERRLGVHFDLIATPYGTGCTQGGLICGSLCENDGRHIVGISISSRTPDRARAVLSLTVQDWFDREGRIPPNSWQNHIDLQCGYNVGGYGQVDKAVTGMVDYMLKENSLPTDPTYTAKALLGLTHYLRENDLREINVLFLHTGGLPLFFDYLNRK